MVAPGIMPLGGAQAVAGPPLTNLTWQLDPSDATKVFQTKVVANPCWTTAGADGVAAQVVVSTIPGAGVENPIHYNGVANGAPLWKQSAPALAQPCLLYDGTNDNMIWFDRAGTTSPPLSTFMGAGAKTILVAFVIHALNNGANLWDHPTIYGDSIGVFGLHAYTPDAGATYRVYAYNHDGSADFCERTGLALNTRYIGVLRHDGTNLFVSINGGAESSVASGNTSNMTGRMHFGGGFGGFDSFSIGECLIYNAALTGADLTAAIDYMMNKWL